MNGKPTLLFIAPTAYPLGGVAVWLSYLIPGLQADGWRVVFGAVNGKFHDAYAYLAHWQFSDSIIIQNNAGTAFGRDHSLRRAIQQVDADIVISVNIPEALLASEAVKQSTKPSLKTVMTIHALDPDYFCDVNAYKDKIDAVLVTNRLTERSVRAQSQFNQKHIYYAPYGVALDHNHDPSEVDDSAAKPLSILYAGRITDRQKRCSDLLQIVAKLEAKTKQYQLLIAGDGDLRIELLEELKRLSSSDNIKYLGNLSQADLFNSAFKRADVLILTSAWETGPIIIWEAMARGLSVVSSRYLGSQSEAALQHEKNCLMFDVGDTDSAVQQLLALNDTKLRKKLVTGGVSLVEQRYTHAKSVGAWSAQLRRVLEQDASPRLSRSSDSAFGVNRQKSGRLERLFGHRGGDFVRRCLGKPALVRSAGDEWPHTLNPASDQYKEDFVQNLAGVEQL